MTTGCQRLLTGLLVAVVSACASPVLPVKAIPKPGQTLVYDRGQVQLHAASESRISVGFLDYQGDTALIRVQVTNATERSLVFGPGDASAELVSRGRNRQACRVRRFEELGSSTDNAWAWDGASSAVGMAGALIPNGGLGGTVAENLLRIGINQGKRQDTEPPEFTLEALKDQYLRLHTLTPGSSYQGLLKVSLPRQPAAGDVLVASIVLGDLREGFSFGFGP